MDTQLALCTFEQSERLKKAGFDWETFPYVYVVKNYTNWGEDHYVGDLVTNPSSDTSKYISAPTVELALQWFEDVKGFKYNLQNNVNAGCWITPVFKGKYFAAIYAKNSKQAKSILLDELLTLIEEEKK